MYIFFAFSHCPLMGTVGADKGENKVDIKYPDITVEFTGADGNAFNLLALVRRALLDHGVEGVRGAISVPEKNRDRVRRWPCQTVKRFDRLTPWGPLRRWYYRRGALVWGSHLSTHILRICD